jgi:hypothetical protein
MVAVDKEQRDERVSEMIRDSTPNKKGRETIQNETARNDPFNANVQRWIVSPLPKRPGYVSKRLVASIVGVEISNFQQ